MILWLNGSINSGKSTVARILSTELKNAASIEIDVFHEFIHWKPIEESVQLNIKNAISVIKNFLEEGIDVIVTYPLSQKNYDFVMTELGQYKNQLHVVTLAPPIEDALTNRGTRELDEWEIERIKHHYAIGIPLPSFGDVIDNSHQTPEETAKKVLELIK
jgi:cytidylate kinase